MPYICPQIYCILQGFSFTSALSTLKAVISFCPRPDHLMLLFQLPPPSSQIFPVVLNGSLTLQSRASPFCVPPSWDCFDHWPFACPSFHGMQASTHFLRSKSTFQGSPAVMTFPPNPQVPPFTELLLQVTQRCLRKPPGLSTVDWASSHFPSLDHQPLKIRKHL